MRRFILFLFTLLGYGALATSCSEDPSDNNQTCEYGCPWVEFSIKARVVDADGKPIKGIEAKGGYSADYLGYFEFLGLTDVDGNLNIESGDSSCPRYMLLTDTDGEANGGEFQDKIVRIEGSFEQIKEGDGRWFDGVYKAELEDITLDNR
ncbi:MAG: radical SAM-associated putative lipoprotein [Alistipes sp.]|nr:radical SAM-associated putative lipoprotein [Alistipes sp.]